MANKIVTVLEADGVTQTDIVSLDVGRQAVAASKSVGLSTEDKAVLDTMSTALAAIETATEALSALITSGSLSVFMDPDSVNANGQATMANSAPVVVASNQTTLPVTPAAGELHLGEVGGKSVTKTITMTADTAIMASADIIADTQQMDAAFRKTDGTGVINSITVFDPDDNAAFAFDVYVHRTTTSMGSENAGITISDANAAAGIIGVVSFATTDAKDLINGRMYHKSNLGLVVSAVSGTDDLYFSLVNGSGTPTFAGGSIPVVVGILQD
jgi:hypothetical protein